MRCARVFQQKLCFIFRFAAGICAISLFASVGAAQVAPASQQPEAALMQELNKYPGLLPELVQLFNKLHDNVKFPAPRTQSRLLPLLPSSTVAFAAIPNYGETAQQTLEVFLQELQSSAPLRDWWHHGELGTAGPKIEDFVDKFYQLHQYLGDEVLISGAMEGRNPKLLAMAEVRKPGLKQFLEQLLAQAGGESKAGVRLLDLQKLPTAKKQSLKDELNVLVMPDYVVAAEDLALLRSFSVRLGSPSGEFVSTPFGQRLAQEYRGGLTMLAAADLQRILEQAPSSPKRDAGFQRSGFADVKYAIWKHQSEGAEGVSQAELSFTGPRRGPAAWLANSGSLRSLDFVSPGAMMAASIVLTNPAQIFEDVRLLAGASSPQFAAIAGGEKALNLNLKDDLLGLLGGEITVELDSITPPKPVWKTMLSVRDAEHLQQTLGVLLAASRLPSEQIDEGGVAYHSVRIPSQVPVEIAYAFVDGYLLIGSSHNAVAESIRLHRSGGSLAKSAKFQASRPPGHSLDASALLYEDPIPIASLQLRRFAPELADSLAQSSATVKPAVVCLYGDETSIREASSSGGVDVAGVLIVAAIAIPNLLRSKIAANEASAVGSLRTVNTAQVVYAATYPQRTYAPNLAALGPDPRDANAYSPQHAGLIDASLANATCIGDAWCTKSGYQFRITATCQLRSCKEYVIVATPVNTNTGTRSFCATSDGVIRYKVGAPVASPVSTTQCRSWQAIQ